MTIRGKKTAFVIVIFIIGAISLLFTSCGKKADISDGNYGIRYDGKAYVIDITDESLNDKDLAFATALEEIFKDDTYTYYLPVIKSSYIVCTLSDGTKMDIKKALGEGYAKLSDLETYNISFYMEDKEGNLEKGTSINEKESEVTDDNRRY